MFFLYTGGSGSPIAARQTAPIFTILIILALICGVIIFLSVLVHKYSRYKKSDKFLEKEMNRPTKKTDIALLAEEVKLSKNEANVLWEVTQVLKCTNIKYLLKSNAEVNELFKNAYDLMKEDVRFTDQKMSDFFECLFKLETFVAQIKTLISSTQIPVQSIVFYISEEGEQYPFTIIKNDKNFFIAEIPDFLINSPNKPEILVRSRFTFKTVDGLSYNFISRIVRYETSADGKNHIVIAHSDQLQCQAQRHFKREFFQEQCFFSSIHINENAKNPNEKYIFSDKKYEGKISNISAGGCCIQTELPVKEKQYINVLLPFIHTNEKIVGIIRRTRKLPNGKFALHIQFQDLPIRIKNQIYTLVYKYEL